MSARTVVPIVGVDMYCPDCRRLLLHIRDDGRADVAVRTQITFCMAAGGPLDGAVVPVECFCLRWRCRLLRTLRRLQAHIGY